VHAVHERLEIAVVLVLPCALADSRRAGTPLDVTLEGNSNAGHTYGTDLSAEEKRALLEYMKTL
jgi:hypothetical protein